MIKHQEHASFHFKIILLVILLTFFAALYWFLTTY